MTIRSDDRPPDSLTPHASIPARRGEASPSLAARLMSSKDLIVDQWLSHHFARSMLERYGIEYVTDDAAENRTFLSSIFDLLVAVLAEGKPGYREVYLDERLRYAPHKADPEIVERYFAEILSKDEDIILNTLDEALREETRGALTAIHSPLRKRPDKSALRLLAVGDCLLNEVRVFLPERLRHSGISLDMRCLYFSAVVGRSLSSEQAKEFIQRMKPHLLSFSFLTYAGLPPYAALVREAEKLDARQVADQTTAIMAIIRQFLAELREHTDAPFLIHNASGLPLTRLRRRLPLPALSRKRQAVVTIMNQALAEYCTSAVNTLLVDEQAVAVGRGYRASSRPVIPTSVTRHALFHTSRFGDFLTAPYEEIIRSFHQLQKAKVLLVDFDNTLWEGVMADGPVRHHIQRQRLLRTLRESGMLLVSVSKNTIANVRWAEMQLSPSDFVLQKISWDLKVTSIAAAAVELGLGLDSFVLIDDNPAERELVRRELPSVVLLDANDAFTWEALERLLAFPNTQATEEARARTELYRAQAERREAQSNALDYPSMMRSLELSAAIGHAQPRDLDRITELVQRTNQFNTTTIRYPRSEIKRLMESDQHCVYVADLSDKFGKYGLVAVAIVSRSERESEIDSFIMSCRAMGFGLEQVMLGVVVENQPEEKAVRGRFIASDRNGPSASLYRDAGFVEEAAGMWRLPNRASVPLRPDWISLTVRE